MAVQGLERLRKLGVKKITWINRSREKIQNHPLAHFCEVEDYKNLHRLVWENAIAFVAVSSSGPILRKEEVYYEKLE